MDINEGLKLIITDHADPSVGLFERSYEIDCPFGSEADIEDRKLFAVEARLLFADFAQGKLTSHYSDEKQEQEHEDI
jgi:hypothetical protein